MALIDSIPSPAKRGLKTLRVPEVVGLTTWGLMQVSPSLHRRVAEKLLMGPYRGSVVDTIQNQIYELESGSIDQVEAIQTVRESVSEAVESGELDNWVNEGGLLAGSTLHNRNKEWFLAVFDIPEGEQHLPHHHNNLTSFQLIISGRLKVKEYDRIERVDEDTIRMKKVTDTVLGPGDYMITTEHSKNVHWFSAEEDVKSINCSIRGYWDDLFDVELDKMGRHYLVPQEIVNDDGTILAEEMSEQQAKMHFEELEGQH